jgi:hypothetical protein
VVDDETENTKDSFTNEVSAEIFNSKLSLVNKNDKMKPPIRSLKSSSMKNNIIPKKTTSSSVFDRLSNYKLNKLSTNIMPNPTLLKVAGLTETTNAGSSTRISVSKSSKSKPKIQTSQSMIKFPVINNQKSISQSAKSKK